MLLFFLIKWLFELAFDAISDDGKLTPAQEWMVGLADNVRGEMNIARVLAGAGTLSVPTFDFIGSLSNDLGQVFNHEENPANLLKYVPFAGQFVKISGGFENPKVEREPSDRYM